MKILFIQPPYTIRKPQERRCQPPLGLAYLASFLRKEHEISILDSIVEGYNKVVKINQKFVRYGLSYAEIKERIESFCPDVVGVSSLFTTQSENARNICKLAKDVNRNIITVLGGAHPSALPEEELQDKNIDFVVIGEGEYSFRDLLREAAGERKFSLIDGIAFKENGAIKVNPKRKFIMDLDRLPFPAWDLLPLEKYSKINRPHGTQTRRLPFVPILTSRGCPNSCVFCSVHNIWGRNFRKRSVENVLSEIEHLINTFGIKEIHFEDDNLTLVKERAVEIFKGIKMRKFDLSWSTPNGVFIDTINKETLNLMKESGCYSISFGIESGDKYVLTNIIKKSLNLDRVCSIIRYSKILGLETTIFFVVGFPNERKEQLKNTFKFARSIHADNVIFFFATALPGTELWSEVKRKNLLPEDFNYIDLRSDRPTIKLPGLSRERFAAMIAKQKLISYIYLLISRPGIFLNKLLSKIKRKFVRELGVMDCVKKTEKTYGFLWIRNKSIFPLNKWHFNAMQEVIDVPIVRGAKGIDIGSGCGYDTYIMAKSNPNTKILSIDLSDGVYKTKKLTSKLRNVQIIRGSILDISLKDDIFDFAYSFGVLHHTISPQKGLLEVNRVLKKNSPAFLYLYEDHCENRVKYIAVKIISKLRKITVRIPPNIMYFLSWILSPLIFITFSVPAKILRKFKASQHFSKKIPFNFGTNTFSLRGDLYDRFSAPIEHRFNRQQVYRLFTECGFEKINIRRLNDNAGWVVWGYKK